MGKPDYPETMSQEDIRLFEEEAREYAQANTPKIKSWMRENDLKYIN